MKSKAKPFLKWAGGKSQLLPKLDNLYPHSLRMGQIDNYIEPFIGGGAVFFDLMQRFHFKKAYISDINHDLILTYKIVQNEVGQLIDCLKEFQNNYERLNEEGRLELFLKIRTQFNYEKVNHNYDNLCVERAAQLIFLNKTCFNGLFRVNSKGGFNVPFGKYPTPPIVNELNLKAASQVLQKVEIKAANYEACLDKVDEKTLVYFDPPYRPLSKTSSFNAYSNSEFGDREQKRLAQFFKILHNEKKAKIMLSNSDPKNENENDNFFDDLFSDFNIHRIAASRAINSNGQKRGLINEILITNYKYEQQSMELNLFVPQYQSA